MVLGIPVIAGSFGCDKYSVKVTGKGFVNCAGYPTGISADCGCTVVGWQAPSLLDS